MKMEVQLRHVLMEIAVYTAPFWFERKHGRIGYEVDRG